MNLEIKIEIDSPRYGAINAEYKCQVGDGQCREEWQYTVLEQCAVLPEMKAGARNEGGARERREGGMVLISI